MWIPDREQQRVSTSLSSVPKLGDKLRTSSLALFNDSKNVLVLPRPEQPELKQDSSGTSQYSNTIIRAGVALGYMGCAILLVFFNKAALSHYDFNHANLITLFQLTCAIVLLIPLRFSRRISFFNSEKEKDGKVMFIPVHVLLKVMPLSLAYLLYMVVGMASLRGVNLPMYTTLRRTTAAFTMVMEYLLMKKVHNRKVVSAVSLMVIGAFVAGIRDLEFNIYGYLMVFSANCSTALYLSVIAKIGAQSGLNSFGLIWCNSVICAPVLLVLVCLNGEIKDSLQFQFIHVIGFQMTMLGSCLLAFALNYFIFLNTYVNSALAQTICGNLKDIFIIGFGFFAFGGVQFELFNFLGMLLGIVGSIYYAYIKLGLGQ